jgi:hypothetical protein
MQAAASHTNGRRFDFAIFDGSGRALLLVETKSRRDVDDAWAAEWRALVLEGAPAAHEPATLLATPDTLFYWAPGVTSWGAPTARVDATSLLAPYLSSVQTQARVDPMVFEWAIGSWLEDLLAGEALPASAGPLAALFSQLGPNARLERELWLS